MNAVVEVILSRRSVREGFREDVVPRPVLEAIVRCGLAAPSSKSARPWRLHVITDRAVLAGIATLVEAAEGIDGYVPADPATGEPRPEWSSTVLESAAILRDVPAAIFIENKGVFSSGRRALLEASPDALAASIVGYTFEIVGLGAAIENMWIAATAQDVSGVFMGDVLIAEREIGELLGATGDLVGVLALGYAEVPPHESRAVAPTPLGADEVHWLLGNGGEV